MRKEPNFKHYTRGGQISFHNLRMWDQITKSLSLICLSFWVIVTGVLTWALASFEKLKLAFLYVYASFLNFLGQNETFRILIHGKTYTQNVKSILTQPFYSKNSVFVLNIATKSACIAFFATFFLGLALAFYFIYRGKAQAKSQFVRGSRIDDCKNVKKMIIKDKCNSDIHIDDFPLIRDSEVKHLLVHGTVGSGKSQLIMKILDCLQKRGDRVIVYDKGASFIPNFYRESHDVILNPFDARCPNWDLWCEAPKETDLENMAESLIPMQGEGDPFWVNAARAVLVSSASRMREEKGRSVEQLLQLLLTSDSSYLEHYLKGTHASTLVSSKIEKTATSIRATLSTYLKSLEMLTGLSHKAPFSIRNTLLDETNKGWLFISSNGEQHKVLKPLISMWLAMASLTLLSLEPDRSRRIWFICDELPSLHKLPLLGETIAEVRKFGGCFLLGMQSFSQLTKVYGLPGAKEIFDLLNTRFFFRSPSSDMARLVASELGEEEIEEARENYSYGANSIRDGISLGSQRVTRPIVAYPEILELKDLSLFLRLPGPYPVTKLSLALKERENTAAGFIKRELPKSSRKQKENLTTSNEPLIAAGCEIPKMKEQSLLDYLE